MAETVSLARKRPRIEGVFGPLTADEDSALRSIMAEVDTELLALGAHLGRSRAGWEGSGLELVWVPSGQLSISSFVGVPVEPGLAVDFYVELRPIWFYGNPDGSIGWVVEASVQADCQHVPSHSSMDTVWDRGEVTRDSPKLAVAELLEAAKELHVLGRQHAPAHWLELAKG